MEDAALAVVLHEETSESVNELDLPSDGDILVVVGPEGGIAPEEIDALVAAGCRAGAAGTARAALQLGRPGRTGRARRPAALVAGLLGQACLQGSGGAPA